MPHKRGRQVFVVSSFNIFTILLSQLFEDKPSIMPKQQKEKEDIKGLPILKREHSLLSPALKGAGLLTGLGLTAAVVSSSVYKKCPPNKLLVIYGRHLSLSRQGLIHNGTRIVKEGGATVFPFLQSCRWLSLEPMAMEIPLKGALSLEKIRVNVPSVFTIAISAEEKKAENAARRLLGMDRNQILDQAEEVIVGTLETYLSLNLVYIVFYVAYPSFLELSHLSVSVTGQMRQVLAGLTIEEINRDRDKFVTQVQEHCCEELE